MLTYLFRRLLLLGPTLLGVSMIVFSVFALAPGGIEGALVANDGNLTPGAKEARERYLKQRYGLDSPPPIQYLRWLNKISPVGMKQDDIGKYTGFGFKSPDLGDSFMRNRPVRVLIAESLPYTLMLQLISVPVTYVIAMLAGLLAARKRGGFFDVASGTFFLGMYSFPVIALSVLMIGFLANANYIKIFPAQGLSSLQADVWPYLPGYANGHFVPGYLLDVCWHLIVPVICLSYGNFAFLCKLTRASVLENFRADYVRTARAKGLRENVVLFRHVFRNSLIPLITFLASLLPSLIIGSVVVENVFGIRGMGQLFVEAAQQRDFELSLGITIITSTLTLLSYLLSDILYMVADPRVTFE